MHETLSGIIERVTFHNPENGFVVLSCDTGGFDFIGPNGEFLEMKAR